MCVTATGKNGEMRLTCSYIVCMSTQTSKDRKSVLIAWCDTMMWDDFCNENKNQYTLKLHSPPHTRNKALPEVLKFLVTLNNELISLNETAEYLTPPPSLLLEFTLLKEPIRASPPVYQCHRPLPSYLWLYSLTSASQQTHTHTPSSCCCTKLGGTMQLWQHLPIHGHWKTHGECILSAASLCKKGISVWSSFLL